METATITACTTLGKLRVTRGVQSDLTEDDVFQALVRHLAGDWGEVSEESRKCNDDALEKGQLLHSSYFACNGKRFWIITEHDRSATTVLLPNEY